MSNKKPNNRKLHQRVKTAKGRSNSSTKWLKRQLNDPYVDQAKMDGYRSRAAYKLIEMDNRLNLLKPNMKIIELGAAPGGWSQVIKHKIGDNGKLLGIDLLEMEPIPGVELLVKDFNDEDIEEFIADRFGSNVDLVLSDMAASTCGDKTTDHLRTLALCEDSFYFSLKFLKEGGSFLCKIFQGGTEQELLSEMKKNFKTVKHIKPPASRKDSSEMYVIALNKKAKI